MAGLEKTPSLQHAVALMATSVEETLINLKRLEDAQISISLAPGRRLFKPLMEGMGLDWALSQCDLEREKNVLPNRDLVTAFSVYAAGKNVAWFKNFPKTYFPIRNALVVPVTPSGYYVEDGKPKIMWVQSWKGRTLNPLQKSILNTVLAKSVFSGDFKSSQLEWVDLREKFVGQGRSVEVLNSQALGFISDLELESYFQVLLEAIEKFAPYKAEKRAERAEKKRKSEDKGTPLFDGI